MKNIYLCLETDSNESDDDSKSELGSYVSNVENVKEKPNRKTKPIKIKKFFKKYNKVNSPNTHNSSNSPNLHNSSNSPNSHNSSNSPNSHNSSPIKHEFYSVYDEYSNLPSSIKDAFKIKRNLTLKQILMIMNLNGLIGEMFNIIHDRIQQKIRRRQIKINYQGRNFHVSMYNWYDLNKIEIMIDSMLTVY